MENNHSPETVDVTTEDSDINQLLKEADRMMAQEYETTPILKDDKEPEESEDKGLKSFVRSYVLPVLWGIIVALILTQVMFFLAVVPSGSMETTIMTNDRIVGNRMVYWFHEPTYGEIIIFWSDEYNEFMVKRVVGCPGDVVAIRKDGVYVNDRRITDDYTQGTTTILHSGQSEWKVPEDSYFVMGDNRESSADSRYWQQTYVPREEIYARYVFRYSLGRNGWYFEMNHPIEFWDDAEE